MSTPVTFSCTECTFNTPDRDIAWVHIDATQHHMTAHPYTPLQSTDSNKDTRS